MRRLWTWFAAAVVAAAPAYAQEAATAPIIPPVVMMDSERLYTDSKYGQSLRGEIEAQIIQLNVENQQIIADLEAEEQDLATRRPTMEVDDFRAEATAFDTKVQDIRRAVDTKEAELARAQSEARLMFYDQARPIVGQLMVRRGAVAVLESRNSFVWIDNIDITNAAIAAIDAALLPAEE